MRLPDPRAFLASATTSVRTWTESAVGGRARNRAPNGRPIWVHHDQAHIKTGEYIPPDVAQRLEEALSAVDGVRWAAHNGVLGRAVVSFDPASTGLSDLVRVVEEAVGPHLADGGPADLDPGWVDAIALGSGALAAGAAIVGRLLRVLPLPVEATALPLLLDLVPRVRGKVAARLGPARTDLVAALAAAALAAAAQTPLTPLADGALRSLRLAEARARRSAWDRAASGLYADAASARAAAAPVVPRPQSLPDGPVERYAARVSAAALLTAGAMLPFPGGLRRSARVLTVGTPRAARQGREAYAAQLGRLLAMRGILVRDPEALRRLDRIDTVILDASALTTGAMVVGEVLAAPGEDDVEAKSQALSMLDADRPRRLVRRNGWVLGPLSKMEVSLPDELAAELSRRDSGGQSSRHRGALGLVQSGRLVAVVTVEAQLHPLASALVAAARRVGRTLIAGSRNAENGGELAQRLRADGTVPGGVRLADSVRAAQREGRVVALVAAASNAAMSNARAAAGSAAAGSVIAGSDQALAAADCGIGVLRRDRRPPWAAHLMGGPSLETVWLTLEGAALARRVSGRSTTIALLGLTAGTLLLLTGTTPAAHRQATAPAAVATLANVVGGAWSAASLRSRVLPLVESTVPWHALPAEDVLRELDTVLSGLSEGEANRRQQEQTTVEEEAPGLLRVTLDELNNPLTAPLAAGAALSTATGGLTDAALVVAVQVANALLGGVQRLAATRALHDLLAASSLQARLLRAGQPSYVGADELVPGDILALQAGDVLPADCRLLEAAGLEMDESQLTGESLPIAKNPAPTLAPAVADRTSMVYAGTTVAAGTATAVVTATGRSTEASRGAHAVAGQEPPGGVEARLRRLTASSLPVAAGAAAVMLSAGLLRGQLAQALGSAVALAVAAVPEGLPFVATVAQLSAARRLSRHNVLVRHPRTMEGLGRLDVVCFDKTGTLTEGRIRLRSVSDGRCHEPAGALTGDRRLVLAAALRASPLPNGDELPPHPTDRAVLAGGQDADVAIDEGAPGWRLVRELPFEPGRGFHAVLGDLPEVPDSSNGQLISVKGAPELILPRCVAWRRSASARDVPPPGTPESSTPESSTPRCVPVADLSGIAPQPDEVRPLDDADRALLAAEVEHLAAQGLRVLAVAERPASQRRQLDSDRVERLEFRGLLGLADPVRPTAAEAVGRLRRAGIDAVMLTGDHPGTARAVAQDLGILGERGVVTGPELDRLDDEQLTELVCEATVFARVSPAHKVTIVQALRRAGRVVAVTGDGANDAPAIRLADVGIALGNPGTAAAREAADMVVTDDRIETIVNAVVEGRAMWAAVRDAVALLLGGNLGEIAFAVSSSLLSPQPVLNARQLLLVNMMTDLVPAIVLAARPPRHISPEDLLDEGPDRSLGTALVRDIAQRAVATTVATTGGWLAARLTGTARRASTVALASLVGAQLAQTAVISRGDLLVLTAAGTSALALVVVVQTPATSLFFGCRPLGPLAWTIVTAAAGTGAIIGTLPLGSLLGSLPAGSLPTGSLPVSRLPLVSSLIGRLHLPRPPVWLAPVMPPWTKSS